MRDPHLRTVTVDFRRIDEQVMVRYEFEDTVPMSYCGSELTADMPETIEIDQFIPMYDLRRYGALKMAEIFTEKAWMTLSSMLNINARYFSPHQMMSGAHEVSEILSKPSRYPMQRMHVSRYSHYGRMRVVENPYIRPDRAYMVSPRTFANEYLGIFPPDIDSTINDAFEAMNQEMERFMGGFAATTTCSTAKESALTLATMEKALATLGAPYHFNGTDKVQSYKTKGGKMPYLSKIAKKLLDADTKVLVKAGYLDSELDLTERGAAELMEVLFMANKPAMVAAAKAKLKEDKENE